MISTAGRASMLRVSAQKKADVVDGDFARCKNCYMVGSCVTSNSLADSDGEEKRKTVANDVARNNRKAVEPALEIIGVCEAFRLSNEHSQQNKKKNSVHGSVAYDRDASCTTSPLVRKERK